MRSDAHHLVLLCLAENPGWSNHVVAMELEIARSTAQRAGLEARERLGLTSAQNECAVFIDRKKYVPLCEELGVTPVEGELVDKVSGMQSGKRVSMRDPTSERRLKKVTLPSAPVPALPRAGTQGVNTLKTLLRRLRAEMEKRDYCRVTITPDTVVVSQVVTFELP